METQKDFKELLELFNARDVKFIIVGGYALAYHGALKNTQMNSPSAVGEYQ